MKLHHTKQKKYQKLVDAGLTAIELRAQMIIEGEDPGAVDEFLIAAYPGYEPSYVSEEVATATLAAPVQPPAPAPAPTPSPEPEPDTDKTQQATQNDTAPPAPKFDPNNLVGESFNQYNQHLKALPLNTLRDFEVFKVEPVIVERYPGLENSPRDMIGVKKSLDRAIQRTRISPKTAMEMNAQVRNSRRYYVLA